MISDTQYWDRAVAVMANWPPIITARMNRANAELPMKAVDIAAFTQELSDITALWSRELADIASLYKGDSS